MTGEKLGRCGHCGAAPWIEGDFPPCDDSECTFPYWEPMTSENAAPAEMLGSDPSNSTASKMEVVQTAPAEMPGDAERFAAAYLGFNPHDASTWDVDIVNRLVRIRSECGDQAFVQEVASLMTPASVHNPHNACCYREQCKTLEARALAAEAALAAERERAAGIADKAAADAAGIYPQGEVRGVARATADFIAAAIRGGEMTETWIGRRVRIIDGIDGTIGEEGTVLAEDMTDYRPSGWVRVYEDEKYQSYRSVDLCWLEDLATGETGPVFLKAPSGGGTGA